MSVITRPTFVHRLPDGMEMPYDRQVARLVRLFEARNWDVPGVTVRFADGGERSRQHERVVSSIIGEDFAIHFTVSGSVYQITIPRRELSVESRYLTVRYYHYTGDNWERDREKFVSAYKTAKNNPDGLYAAYRTGCYCMNNGRTNRPHDHHEKVDPNLIPVSEQASGEALSIAQVLDTQQVLADFATWLAFTLIPRIDVLPAAVRRVNIFREQPHIPMPAGFGPLFCVDGHETMLRIRSETRPKFAINRTSQAPHWGVKDGQAYPIVTYYGSTWCHFGEEPSATFEFPDDCPFAFRVTLNRANDVYVVDRQICQRVKSDNDQMTTLVPITEYTGGYRHPLVLVARPLDFDEVTLIGGPYPTGPQRPRRRGFREWLNDLRGR